jgi:hypothetical protein
MWTEREYQLGVCCAAGGAHIEVYWSYKIFGEFVHFLPQTAYIYLHWSEVNSLFIGCGISLRNWKQQSN